MSVAIFLGDTNFLGVISRYPLLLKAPFQLRANDPQGSISSSRSSGGNHHGHVQAPVTKVETSPWVVEGTDCISEATERLDGAKERSSQQEPEGLQLKRV